MTEKTIKAIESILSKGDRVELIPVKDGVRVVRVQRETIPENPALCVNAPKIPTVKR